jgi:hypothetical protein
MQSNVLESMELSTLENAESSVLVLVSLETSAFGSLKSCAPGVVGPEDKRLRCSGCH